MNAEHRLAALRRRLADSDAEAMLVSKPTNVLYLTGFEDVLDSGANVACVVTSDVARAYTDFRYQEAAEAAAVGTPWATKVPEDTLYTQLCRDLAADGVTTLAVESSVPYGRFEFVSQQFGGHVVVVDQWVEELRQVKEAREVERIAAAAALADETMRWTLERIGPGKTERELALEIEMFMRRSGAEAVAFPPIVASGSNSSKPHAVASDRAIDSGDLVVIDLGPRVEGYCADLSRTVVVGSAGERERTLYDAVRRANEAGIAACRGGVRSADLHAEAARVLGDAGLGDSFGHGLGHGVGLEVHELPALGMRSTASVRSGSVLTIEPGAYVRGFGGVRIEDLVVVEQRGCRVLSAAPKDLIEVS